MALKWEKIGNGTWLGIDGWLQYHIDCRDRQGRGRLRQVREYLLTKGGIAAANWQGAYRTLSDAKKAAQKEAVEREDRLLALPNAPSECRL